MAWLFGRERLTGYDLPFGDIFVEVVKKVVTAGRQRLQGYGDGLVRLYDLLPVELEALEFNPFGAGIHDMDLKLTAGWDVEVQWSEAMVLETNFEWLSARIGCHGKGAK
jgi:hypothetical protein